MLFRSMDKTVYSIIDVVLYLMGSLSLCLSPSLSLSLSLCLSLSLSLPFSRSILNPLPADSDRGGYSYLLPGDRSGTVHEGWQHQCVEHRTIV